MVALVLVVGADEEEMADCFRHEALAVWAGGGF